MRPLFFAPSGGRALVPAPIPFAARESGPRGPPAWRGVASQKRHKSRVKSAADRAKGSNGLTSKSNPRRDRPANCVATSPIKIAAATKRPACANNKRSTSAPRPVAAGEHFVHNANGPGAVVVGVLQQAPGRGAERREPSISRLWRWSRHILLSIRQAGAHGLQQ
jgi:hypothetical protein